MQLVVVLGRRGAETLPPQGDLDCQVNVQVQVKEDEHGEAKVLEVDGKNEVDHNSFHQRRHEVEADILHGLLCSLDAAVHRADDVPHLLPEVPVERHLVQVRKRPVRDLDVRGLLDPDVHQGLELLEGLRQEAQEGVHDEGMRHLSGQVGPDALAEGRHHTVDRVRQADGRYQVRCLRAGHADPREKRAQPVHGDLLPLARGRPEVGLQHHQRLQEGKRRGVLRLACIFLVLGRLRVLAGQA
mmetsp:Transcript_34230/g.92667  ORF Transcript_34230/g.92667 Transcript_34230/m.92667 type:complete len:242 (+) Transcript_34230:212-937(+)